MLWCLVMRIAGLLVAIERLDGATPADVPAMFWAGAALAGEMALADNQLVRLTGDGPEFERLLQQALTIDGAQQPDLRLANLIAQKRARFLLASADRLFGSGE